MPWPISPAPATNTRSMLIESTWRAARSSGPPTRAANSSICRRVWIDVVGGHGSHRTIRRLRPSRERAGAGSRRSASAPRTSAAARASRAAPSSARAPDSRRWSIAASSSGTPAPVAAVVIRTGGPWIASMAAAEHRPELAGRALGAGPIALVHDHEVGHLEQAGLDRLDLVAHLRRLEDDRRVGRRRDLDLALAGARPSR